MITLIEISRIGKFTVTVSRIEVARGWEVEVNGEYCLMGTEFPFPVTKSFGNEWW